MMLPVVLFVWKRFGHLKQLASNAGDELGEYKLENAISCLLARSSRKWPPDHSLKFEDCHSNSCACL